MKHSLTTTALFSLALAVLTPSLARAQQPTAERLMEDLSFSATDTSALYDRRRSKLTLRRSPLPACRFC